MEHTTPDIVQDRIKDIIVSIADSGIDKNTIEGGDSSLSELGLNSLNMIRMMVEIEKEFDIEIDFDEINPEIWSSLDTLTDYILKSN